MKKNQQIKKRKKIVYEIMCCKEYQPMRAKELAVLLQIPAGKREELHKILDMLLEEGKISINKRGRYEAVRSSAAKKEAEKKSVKAERKKGQYYTGTFISHPRGFGFLEIPEAEEDIFIPEESIGTALHGDTVQIVVKKDGKDGKRCEGEVVKVLERGTREVVGTYQQCDGFGFVVTDNQRFLKDVFIPAGKSLTAEDGDKVLAEIKDHGNKRRSPEGKIIEILGKPGECGVDVLCVAKSYELPMEFPEKVAKQAERIKETLNEGDFYGREDLRDVVMVTIDGEDAKDLDDAVSLTKEEDLYHLGVHIADVSNYVQYNSALDKEALKRGTSVYLADRVIPMLPKKLSNGICSLNAGEDRLALSCLMDIDKKGRVVSHRIVESVIHVKERMSYTNVKKILLQEDEELEKRYEELLPMFFQMKELSELLRNRRKKRGAIDFDFPESKLVLDEKGKVVDIYPYEQNIATRLIEDFMLAANETVAEEYCMLGLPFVYRTHENPDMEKMETVLEMVHQAGIKVKKGKETISPKEVQKILKELEGMECEPFFARLILRSMKQAKYTVEDTGHFGLAAKYYCHFTSPIRRYPDLQIHRIIKETLRGKMTEAKIQHYRGILEEVARQSSAMERRAEEVERETIKMKKAEYMKQHIGEAFEGTVSGVTEWGFYVELDNTVEGLVHVNSLTDDYYSFDKDRYCLVGDMTGRTYTMGQRVKVWVENADENTKTVDFKIERMG
ncbi:ribonuclease R [Blautia hansenii]|uniref:Ribonuclease R n=1 Tax=Blautia hansenii DSM 20583 TaxID=537007 RepID=C9L766_BLAHA|nr:ribonuclease R [Blautia hansenii]ASW16419.1 ribonuclease R [Blautia hansenii DSM 20583]EEX22260.1 ribonuclease R [Blautia hansenii DSM 20583]UWO09710.1 ribonuclease R [Blautia hansenii DSM 20583]